MSFSANRVAYSGIPTVVSHSEIEVGWDISTRPFVPGYRATLAKPAKMATWPPDGAVASPYF
jgi:hypothetical protein